MSGKNAHPILRVIAATALTAVFMAAGCGGRESGLTRAIYFDEPSAFAYDAGLISVNAAGNSLLELAELPDSCWTATYKDPRPMSGPEYHVLDFCPDGNIVVVGDHADFNDWSSQVIAGKYYGNGMPLPGWPKFYKGPQRSWNEGQDVTVDAEGNITVAGYAVLWRLDAEGNVLPGWPQYFMGDRAISTAVIEDDAGDVIACGTTTWEGSDKDHNGLRDASPPDAWGGGVDRLGNIAAAATCQSETSSNTVK